MNRVYQPSTEGTADEFLEILARTLLAEMPEQFDAVAVKVLAHGRCPCGGSSLSLLFKRGGRVSQLLVCPNKLGDPGTETPRLLACRVGAHGNDLLAMKGV